MHYSIYDYARMLADVRRIDAYRRAIHRYVGIDSVVLDLGSGLGLFALEAERAGAKRVYAIEPNPVAALSVAIAKKNASRIEVFERNAQEVALEELAEPISLLVFDVRGALPFFAGSLATLQDVKRRLCAPDCRFLPQRDVVYAALAHCPEVYAAKAEAWRPCEHSFDFSPLSQSCVSSWHREPCSPEYFVAEPQHWHTLDYATLDFESVSKEVVFEVAQRCTVHGVFLYVDVEFDSEIGYSCSSPAEASVSGSAFFPFRKPQLLSPGQSVRVTIAAHALEGRYVWEWNSKLEDNGECVWSEQQSSLADALPNPASLLKRSSGFCPALQSDAELLCFTLALFDGRRTLAECASLLQAEYPKKFTTIDAALAYVGECSAKHSR